MSLKIAGIGTAVPEFSINQKDSAEASKFFCPAGSAKLRLLPALYRRSGVAKRHSVLLQVAEGDPFDRQSFYRKAVDDNDAGPTTVERMRIYEREAPGLALLAGRRAVEDAGIEAGSITHLVTVSCTGFYAPGVDALLIKDLGLSPTVERTHVGFMGCHGALNGIRVANSFVSADPEARVLVCAVELCTLHFFYGWDPEKIVANSLFADGAAALIGVSRGDEDDTGWVADASGTLLMADSEDAMTWKIGDHGFHMTLSARVPELIRENVGAWLDGWLAGHGLSAGDVATWAVHPGGPRILTAFRDAVGLHDGALDVSRGVLSEYGNMSSPTLLFILERLRASNAPRPCVAVGFGPGLVVETTLLR